MTKPGGITVPISTVKAYYEAKGIDWVAEVNGYVKAWIDKVPAGTQMLFARMRCVLADGPCGCPPNAYVSKCKGRDLPVAIELFFELMDNGSIDGISIDWLPAPEHFLKGDGTGIEQEFLGEALVMYVHKN